MEKYYIADYDVAVIGAVYISRKEPINGMNRVECPAVWIASIHGSITI